MFQTTFQAQTNSIFWQKKTKTLFQDKNIFLDYVQALHLPKFEVMLEGEQSTFGTSAETRRTVSLAMVKEEECSNLSLLFGVRKHRRSDEKQPKAKGERFSFSSIRPPQRLKGGRGGKRGESWEKKKEWTKTEGGLAGAFGVCFFLPFPSAMAFVEISKSRREKSDQRAWADLLVAENTVGTSP